MQPRRTPDSRLRVYLLVGLLLWLAVVFLVVFVFAAPLEVAVPISVITLAAIVLLVRART